MVPPSERVNRPATWLEQKPGGRAPGVMLVGKGTGTWANHSTEDVDGLGQTL